MNGIDISSHNAGINLKNISFDFAFIKVSQGTSYLNPYRQGWINQCMEMNKCFGLYHYISGVGAVDEADHFISNIQPYIGRAILVLDWESIQNKAWRNEAYLETMIKRVIQRTGVKPMIYASLSVFPWDLCEKYGLTTWVAQYASNNAVNGFQEHPWNEGNYKCTIRQYTSEGWLPGWGARLDLNKAYINRDQWNKIATGNATSSPSPSKPSTSNKLAVDGYWGPATTKAIQKMLGTTQDGIVSNQPYGNKKYVPSSTTASWNWKNSNLGNGSLMVRELQKKIGTTSDGWFGNASATALQKALNKRGAGLAVDGYFGSASCKALQTALNSGWKL